MAFALAPSAVEAGYRLHAYDTIGSTNTEALAAARAGEAGPTWFVARHQSEGRGRRGTAWQTSTGNLAATLLLTLDLPPATAATLGFAAGVALVRALDVCCEAEFSSLPCGTAVGRTVPTRSPPPRGEGLGVGGSPPGSTVEVPPERPPPRSRSARLDPPAGRSPDRKGEGSARRDLATSTARASSLPPEFTLKWPNDVLAGGGKLAGILLATEEAAGRRVVAIGIGVNVVEAPDGLPYRATSLHALGCATSAETLFQRLSAAWLDVEGAWDRGRGFDAVRRAWLDRADGLGRAVAVRSGADVALGRFETIDEDGRLVIRAQDGTMRRVSAGEVHFGAAASAAAEADL